MITILNKYNKIPVAAKAAVWFVACSMLQKCIGFITVPVFTRLMPVEEYGLYSTYLSWHSILVVFCSLNISHCVFINNYTKANTQEEKDFAAIPLLSLSMFATFILFLLYFCFSPIVDPFIGMPSELTCLLFVDIFVSLSMPFWTIQQRFRYKYKILVIQTLALVLCNSVLGIVLVYLAKENQALVRALSMALVNLVFGIVFYFYYWKRAKTIFSTKGWGHTLKVQLPTIPHVLSIYILHSSDRIMITNLIGAAQTAIYSVAYSAGFIINILKSNIVDAMKPWVYEKIKAKEFSEIASITNSVLVFVTIITILFCAFAPEIVYIMAPPKYYEAIYVIPPIAVSSFFTFLYNMFSVVGMYYEKTGRIMWASVIGALLNLVLNYLLIPEYGYIVAGYTTLVSFIFFTFAHYYIMRKICKSEMGRESIYDMKFIIFMSFVSLGVMVLFSIIYSNPTIRYLILVIVVLILLIKRNYFLHVLKKIKKK